MAQERLTIPVTGANLAAVLHLPEAGGRWPCVVAAHGLLSSKDSDKYVEIGEAFSRQRSAFSSDADSLLSRLPKPTAEG